MAIVTLLFASCGEEKELSVVKKHVPVAVKVNAVEINNDTPFLSVSGKIQAQNSAELSTRIMGFVDKVYVKVGDKVKKGQLLVALKSSDLQAKRLQVNAGITEATAAFNNAKNDFDRFQNLFASNSASQKELDDMTANYEMAKARLEGAKQMKNEVSAQFAYTNIKAPFSGVITGKYIESGDMANPGMPLIALEAPGKFEVMVMVPENEISKIKSDIKVNVNVNSIAETVKGSVLEVSTSAKNTGGQYLVKIALDSTEANVLSGMFTTVQFPISKTEKSNDKVLIPTEALVVNGQLSGVYTVSQSNTALLRWLRLGRVYGDKVEVLSGLSSQESYIISSEGKLYNGAHISIQ